MMFIRNEAMKKVEYKTFYFSWQGIYFKKYNSVVFSTAKEKGMALNHKMGHCKYTKAAKYS